VAGNVPWARASLHVYGCRSARWKQRRPRRTPKPRRPAYRGSDRHAPAHRGGRRRQVGGTDPRATGAVGFTVLTPPMRAAWSSKCSSVGLDPMDIMLNKYGNGWEFLGRIKPGPALGAESTSSSIWCGGAKTGLDLGAGRVRQKPHLPAEL